ncbi:hypothetical protein [Azospirillum canadense]|uniref:hypothetical protein n=1 Tax=Azospirillum canadense TaxID=403962 RepID=UPI0022271F0E|nr:hypothetical protein [Azospirillum canadense]MCW2242278.1 hypothetical protein [Azospirillum canadense]
MNTLTIATVALLLACACRERGQWHSWLGTTGARVLFWGFPVGAVSYALTGAAWPSMASGALAYVGMAVIPHGAGQNLAVAWSGPVDDGLAGINRAERMGYMATAWAARMWLIALPLAPEHPAALWLPIIGAWAAVAYLLGLYLPVFHWRLTCATEWGEFLTGLGVGAALAGAL